MTTNQIKPNVPSFISDTKLNVLIKNEELILSLMNRLSNVINILKSPRVKQETGVIWLASHITTNATAVGVMLKARENKVTFNSYFKTLKDLVEELEMIVVSNAPAIWRKNLLLHYQTATNAVLIEAQAKNILNYCSAILVKPPTD